MISVKDIILARKLGGGSGGSEWIGDGNTHIWVSLQEGRTSPRLGVCPNGTVTVDWGDGTEPDVLTGTGLTKVIYQTHDYAEPGDYVITLGVVGGLGFLGNSSYGGSVITTSISSELYKAYLSTVKRIELGNGVTSIGEHAFKFCYGLESVYIPEGVTSVGSGAFYGCSSLRTISIPDGVTSIGDGAFYQCHGLKSIRIPDGIAAVEKNTCASCYALSSIRIPDGVTRIGDTALNNCYSLVEIIVPGSVVEIGASAFSYCRGIRCFDFRNHTTVPTLSNKSAFDYAGYNYEIRVPAALYDEWVSATNWTTLASKIVAI